MNSRERILSVLRGEVPDRVPFSPNIWQWYEYQKLHDLLPEELASCSSQLEVQQFLGVDIFSRNLLTDIRRDWFGGHAHNTYRNVEVAEQEVGAIREVTYHTPAGLLTESFEFQTGGCTMVQRDYLFKDFNSEYPAWKALFLDRDFVFDRPSFDDLTARVGEDGLVIAGEITCPLKQLHILARSDTAAFLLYDHEPEMMELMDIYAEKALRLVEEMVTSGVKVVMTMDNLDSTFYPPPHFERYCTGFFSRATEICHKRGAFFFSHACGQQKSILPLVTECGIDGLEGIAFPPLGDVELWEAKQAGDRFIVEGGLSATQLEGEVSTEVAEKYIANLFRRMSPKDRFILSMSCNTSIRTSWDTLRRYRDAWLKYAAL
jgi:hypothetical protein